MQMLGKLSIFFIPKSVFAVYPVQTAAHIFYFHADNKNVFCNSLHLIFRKQPMIFAGDFNAKNPDGFLHICRAREPLVIIVRVFT